MQVRVPWTQAWLCTKDFRRKCTGAGVAAKSRFPAMQPSEVRQGLTSTKLGLKSHWTVGVTWTESLDSRDLARYIGIEVQTNSDDEEEQVTEMVIYNASEEYPLIEFFSMFTVKELHADLQGTVKEEVWDLTGKEVGLIKGVEPIKITLKPNAVFPQLPQYNVPQDVLMKVAQITGDFLKQGVLKEVLSSPCNSPIMGLKKPCGKVRVVQDLRKVNNLVVKCCPVVPNPAVILFQIPCDAEWYTVVDLSQAFFSVPLHEDSQFLFSFKFLDRVYSWCRLPQGYTVSPSLFNHILKKNLESLELPYQSTLVQYTDDLLIASRTRDK
ncbi:hypothetical protein NDU88_004080, partial [Pleurodeles waltl]